MKIYNIIKTILFLGAGVLILVFYEPLMENDGYLLKYVVGSMMVYFGAEEVILILIEKKLKKNFSSFFNSIITAYLGILTIAFLNDIENSFVIICVIWATWSILREGHEIAHKVVKKWDNKVVAIINLTESIIVIVLSSFLIIEPAIHNVKVHLILLAIELFIEILWPRLDNLETKVRSKNNDNLYK